MKQQDKDGPSPPLILERYMPVDGAMTANEATRTVEAIISTGADVERRTIDGATYIERLEITPDTVRIGRLNAGAPLLDSHDRFSGIRAIIGAVARGSARIEDGKLVAQFKFSSSPLGERAFRDVKDGIIRNVSVGYLIHKTEVDEEASPPVHRVLDWEPHEVSAVAIPADAGAQFRKAPLEDRAVMTKSAGPASADEAAPVVEDRIKKTIHVEELADSGGDALTQDTQLTLAAERKRAASIVSIGERFGAEMSFVSEHLAKGTTELEFRAALLDRLHLTHKDESGIAQIAVIQDEGQARREAMVEAIEAQLAQAAGEKHEVPERARRYMGMRQVQLAAECLDLRQDSRLIWSRPAEVFERAFAGHSSSDYPGIFVDAMGRRLQARYALATPTYRSIAQNYNAVDFKTQHVIRAGDFPVPQLIGEGGEIKSGTFGESKETFAISAYGVMLSFTRVALINDQLNAFQQVIGSAAQRVADWENSVFYTMMLSAAGAGPTLATDNKAVFHVDHGNLAAVAAAITIVSVGIGRQSMMGQVTLDGLKANFTPAILLTGAAKQTEAEQLLTSITPAQPSNAVPAAMRRLEVISDANIPGNAWYLFTAPGTAPVFIYGSLEGLPGPRLARQDAWNVQGITVKLEIDFGVAAVDFRGAFRNAGA